MRENRKLFIKDCKTKHEHKLYNTKYSNTFYTGTAGQTPTFLSSASSHRLLSSAAFTCVVLCAGLSVSTVKRRGHSGRRAVGRS